MDGKLLIIIANVISGIGMITLFISTQLKEKKSIIGLQAVNHTLAIIGGLILKGYSGVVQDAIGLVRNIVVIKGKQTTFLKILFVGLGLVLGIVFNNHGWIGLLPIIGATEYAIVIVNEKATERTIKKAIIASTILWGIYSLFILNYVNFVANTITAISAAINLMRNKKVSHELEV